MRRFHECIPLLSSQQMDQLRIRWALSQMTLTSHFIQVCSINFKGVTLPSTFYFLHHELNLHQNRFALVFSPPVACSYFANHSHFFPQQFSLGPAAAHVAVRRTGLPVYSFISLLLLLALPCLLLLLLLHNHVSFTFWSKTPSEVQPFHPGIFLTSCPPWSAGMWTNFNSNLEKLKVREVWVLTVIDWVVSENEFAKLADNMAQWQSFPSHPYSKIQLIKKHTY